MGAVEIGPVNHLTPDQVAQLNRYSKLVLFHSVGGDPAVFYGSPDLESLEAARDLVATPQFLGERSAFRTYAETGGYLRVYTRPYRSHAGRQGVIRVMERMGDVGLLLSNFRIALLLLAPIVVAVAAAVSWWLAGRALTPVVVVTELAREIEATQLSRRLPGRPVPDEIGRLIETFNQMVVESFSERAAALGVRLEMTPSPEVLIPGDERWLRQLVLNLVDNAVRFSVRGEGRAAGSAVAVSASVAVTVTASVSADDEQASLVVDDGGPGIPEADLDRVFERFYRGVPGPRDGRRAADGSALNQAGGRGVRSPADSTYRRPVTASVAAAHGAGYEQDHEQEVQQDDETTTHETHQPPRPRQAARPRTRSPDEETGRKNRPIPSTTLLSTFRQALRAAGTSADGPW